MLKQHLRYKVVLHARQRVHWLHIIQIEADSLHSLFREHLFSSPRFDIVMWKIDHDVSQHRASRYARIDVSNRWSNLQGARFY
jgi:hypothetical protein